MRMRRSKRECPLDFGIGLLPDVSTIVSRAGSGLCGPLHLGLGSARPPCQSPVRSSKCFPRYSGAQAGGAGNLVSPDWPPLSRDQGAYCGLIMRVYKLTRSKVSPIPSSNCFVSTLLV